MLVLNYPNYDFRKTEITLLETKSCKLVMSKAEKVKKELYFIGCLMAAHVAGVWVLIAVVAHVHSVHDDIAKQHITVRAVVDLLHVLPSLLPFV